MSSGVILHDTFLPKKAFLTQGNGMASEPSWEVQQSQHFSGVACPQGPLVAIVSVFCTQVLTNIVYPCCALTLPLFWLCLARVTMGLLCQVHTGHLMLQV